MSPDDFVKNLKESGYKQRQLNNGATELTLPGTDKRYFVRPSKIFGVAIDAYRENDHLVKYGFQ